MSILGPPPITATELVRRITSDSDQESWDSGEHSIKNLLHDLGRNYGHVFCRKKGLPQEVDIQEWLLDLVWMDKEKMAINLAVESELSRKMAHRLEDFEKLMSTKSPLKLFIYTTGKPDESRDVRRKLEEYLNNFSQHLEGEEYILMEVKNEHANFYRYTAPRTGSVTNVVFAPFQV